MGKENRKNNVMIGDNDSSHFSNDIIDKCEMNSFIKYVCFMPNSNHLSQLLNLAKILVHTYNFMIKCIYHNYK